MPRLIWSSCVLLLSPVAGLLTGLLLPDGKTLYGFDSSTEFHGRMSGSVDRPSTQTGIAQGEMDATLWANELRLRLYTRAASAGPITAAYMTSRSNPVPNEINLVPFLKQLSNYGSVTFGLSRRQAAHALQNDWMVVVRSAGYSAARYVGHTTACKENRKRIRVCDVDMVNSGQDDAEKEVDSSLGMFTAPTKPGLWIDPEHGYLSFQANFDFDRNVRHVSTVDFAMPDKGEVVHAEISESDPSSRMEKYVLAYTPGTHELVEAFQAGRVEIVLGTDASPGVESVSALRVDPNPVRFPSHTVENLVLLAALALPFGLAALFLDLSRGKIRSNWARGAEAVSIFVASAITEGVILVLLVPHVLAPTSLH